MFLFFVIIILLAVVLLSGEIFLRGALALGRKLKISPFILGSTVVAVGTSSPDLFIASISSLKGFYDISVSALIGSGIVNILIGIGLASIIGGIMYDKTEKVLHFGMCYNTIFTISLIVGLILTKGRIGIVFSVLLFLSAALFLFLNIWVFSEVEEINISEKENLLISCLLFFGGLISLGFFSDLLLKFVIQVSDLYSVPKKVIASSVVGLGNSLPEIITCIMAALKKRSRVVIGNIVGSNIFILGGLLGTVGLISNLQLHENVIVILPILALDIPFLLISTLAFFIIFKIKSRFGLRTGLLFIFIYLFYTLLQLNII
jgi:cation:H+ antiporter